MNPQELEIEDFDYPLPEERIAKHPLAVRDACKLLVRNGDGTLEDRRFTDLTSLLPVDCMLVCNNTRVINARLRFRKAGGSPIEIFCLEPHEPADYERAFAATDTCQWQCFVGNSKKWKQGELYLPLTVDGHEITLAAKRVERLGKASIVNFSWDCPEVTFSRIIDAAGEIPIPPYLNRSTEESDAEDYQTVYSVTEGSVAAPTAGLHFTPGLLDTLKSNGVDVEELTLHVGAGTFQPVQTDRIGDHPMHAEFISVSRRLVERLARQERPVIAVGTTSVRTLESLYHAGAAMLRGRWTGEVEQWAPYEEDVEWPSVKEALNAVLQYLDDNHTDRFLASTRIIIAPGYTYRIVQGMVTNFHQPQSTLLLLVSAFTRGDWRNMYDHALAGDYRFLSYGDACLLL
ncbi:MAG: S-adenosylmethionine:tRNA ribosyltransferase-isomerase [Bacteroidales bacterium]|nr:S-adenosylmethionine:tRNA ribosyltransferase-isomerase [Bacteroidales bacterium]